MGRPARSPGFSLVEILVVCAVLAVLLALSVPAVNSLARASELQRAGSMIADAIGQARQIATAQLAPTELRFVEVPSDSTRRWQAYQIWAANPRGGQLRAVTRLQRLPNSTCLASNLSPLLSPLLTAGSVKGTLSLTDGSTCPYAGVRFRPDGSLEGTLDSTENYVTVVANVQFDTSEPPPNFIGVQINAYTGKASIHQP